MIRKIGIVLCAVSTVAGTVRAGQTELLSAYSLLEDHINGVSSLTAAEINAQATVIGNNAGITGDTAASISASFQLVQTYETVKGPLFQNSVGSNFSRTDTSTADKALALALLKVYQAILDDVYNSANLANHRALLDGAEFMTADFFPGAASPPVDSNAVYSVQINASQPTAWGYPVDFMTQPARRPTGAYLAPGSIATVTVPPALVNKGFQIRVGAHVADLKNKSSVKRIDRVTVLYDITGTNTAVANPLGGGIYIEVPYEAGEGLVTVAIKNTIRSPFYSNSAARHTTLQEWQDTERHYPGPWADFESDKFMMNVPTGWIYAYDDPETTMANWDKAMDAISDLQGLPRIRPKTVLYCQIDRTLDANVYSPGYPQSNDNYNPNATVNGHQDHDLLNGPKFCNHVLFHELGHAVSISKFSGEVESAVNLLYVPVHNRMFNVPLEEAFGKSLNTQWGGAMNRKHAAINWVVTDKFRNGQAMSGTEMKYQHRGHAKYVEIAALFGWDALGDFWKSVAVDYENGISYPKNTDPPDSRIIRMSRAAAADLLPLIHFWGVHPNNAANIESTLASEGIGPSAAIYDRLKYYQSVVPMTAAEFAAHDSAVHNLINVNEQSWYTSMRTGWTAALGQASVDRIQEIIDAYFPDGRPIEQVPCFEGFEDGVGGWAQATDDDYEWRRNTGGTATSSAGPDGAATGSYYMYAEGHDAGGSYKTASFQCRFDFSAVRSTTLSFDYHMHGNYINLLAVDVFDGSTWTSNVWSRSGQQHSSGSDPWSHASVDLTAFSGHPEVTVRFRAENGQWNAADPAIDNVGIDVGPVGLPYAESFENGWGAWLQSTNDDFNWTRNRGYTDTTNTGPSAASDGSWYAYVEGHDTGQSYKTAALECTFDLSAAASPQLSFDYHMFGPYIDFLALDVFDGSSWSSNVWKRSGSLQSSSEAAWLNAVVDLSPYIGQPAVTLRFRAKQQQWHAADTAIDNLRVGEIPLSPYQQWSAVAFAAAPPGTDTSETGNPDGDANANRIEWILVTDPLTADSPVTSMQLIDPNLVLTYTRRKLSGISVYAQYSPTLIPPAWSTTGFTELVIGDNGTVETVAVLIPYNLTEKFIRLVVEE